MLLYMKVISTAAGFLVLASVHVLELQVSSVTTDTDTAKYGTEDIC